MQYRDPEKEKSFGSAKSEAASRIVDNAATLAKNRFNIITNEGPSKRDSRSKATKNSLHSRDWNFISHLPNEQQPKAPIFYDQSFNDSFAFRPKSLVEKTYPASTNPRAFDIISNKFLMNDEEKVREEIETLQNKIIEKYWQTHNYDPIRIKYIDPEKEAEFQEQRKLINSIHGSSQIARYPPRYLISIYLSTLI